MFFPMFFKHTSANIFNTTTRRTNRAGTVKVVRGVGVSSPQRVSNRGSAFEHVFSARQQRLYRELRS